MATNIGPKIGIDGEASYKAALGAIIAEQKKLKSACDAVTSSFDENTTEQEKAEKLTKAYSEQIENLKDKQKLLQDEMERQNKKLKEQEEAVKKASEQYGENSKEVKKASDAYLKQKEALDGTETAYNKTTTELNKAKTAMKNVGTEADNTTEKSSKLTEVFKGNFAADLATQALNKAKTALRNVRKALEDCIKGSAAFADDILTQSVVTGISTDALQEYQYMAELVDVSVDTMTGSMTKLIRNMNTARDGTGTAAEAFASLGISVTDSNGELRDSQTVFDEVITALGKMDNETERDAAGMAIFGKSAQDLNPLIEAGADQIEAFRQEAHDMGYVLDEEALSSLGAVDDSFQRLENSTTTVKNSIGVALAPVVESMAEKLVAFTQDSDKMNAALIALSVALGIVAAAVLAVQIVANPIGVLIAAGTAAIAGLTFVVIDNWETIKNALVTAWEWVKQAASDVGEWLQQAGKDVANFFIGVANGAIGVVETMVNGLIDAVNWGIEKINKMLSGIGGVLGLVGIDVNWNIPDVGKVSIPRIPMLANGGVLTSGTAIVGEAGPELLTVNAGRAVVQPLGRNGGAVINLTANFNGAYTHAQGAAAVRDLNRQLGRLYG